MQRMMQTSWCFIWNSASKALKCIKWEMIPWMQMKFKLFMCGLPAEVKSTHIPPRDGKIFFSLTHLLTPLPPVSHPLPLQISVVIYSKTYSQSDLQCTWSHNLSCVELRDLFNSISYLKTHQMYFLFLSFFKLENLNTKVKPSCLQWWQLWKCDLLLTLSHKF